MTEIGRRIKARREEINKSVDDIALEIDKNRTTVYRYENGNIENLPTSVLEPLAEALHTTPEYLMGWTDDPINYIEVGESLYVPNEFMPHDDEEDRIKGYLEFLKRQDEDGEELAKELLDVKFSITHDEQAHIKKYRKLDDTDKKAVDGLLDTLSTRSQQSEQAKEFIVIPPDVLQVPYYPHIASAGSGQFLFDDLPADIVQVSEQCDMVIGVNGNSMEPTYYDNDMLLVVKQNSVQKGEIGIFIINGDAYVKEYQGDKLVSHNKDFPDIQLTELMEIRCLGKVIGKKNKYNSNCIAEGENKK